MKNMALALLLGWFVGDVLGSFYNAKTSFRLKNDEWRCIEYAIDSADCVRYERVGYHKEEA